MDWFIITLVLLVVFSKDANINNPIDKSNTMTVRALLMIAIFLRHVCPLVQTENSGVFIRLLEGKGFWFVAVFFFFSGYGLFCGIKHKKDYLRFFWKKRIPSIVVPYATAVLTFYILRVVILQEKLSFTPKAILERISSTFLLVDYSWYVFGILVLYIIFYFSFKGKNIEHNKLPVVVCSAGVVAFSFLCAITGVNIAYYISTFSFILGMVYACFFEKISPFMEKTKYLAAIILPAMMFYLTKYYLVGYSNGMGHFRNILFALEENLISLSFVYLTILLLHKVDTKSKLGTYLGNISYEAYLVQGFGMRFFRSDILYIANDQIYVIVSLATCFAMAKLLHTVNRQTLIFCQTLTGKDKDMV